jgi:hypothetical protein
MAKRANDEERVAKFRSVDALKKTHARIRITHAGDCEGAHEPN